ncbi:TPA: hypothetical protein ACH3X1_001474 [Trebouxia sp. C0004]
MSVSNSFKRYQPQEACIYRDNYCIPKGEQSSAQFLFGYELIHVINNDGARLSWYAQTSLHILFVTTWAAQKIVGTKWTEWGLTASPSLDFVVLEAVSQSCSSRAYLMKGTYLTEHRQQVEKELQAVLLGHQLAAEGELLARWRTDVLTARARLATRLDSSSLAQTLCLHGVFEWKQAKDCSNRRLGPASACVPACLFVD